MGAIRSLEYLCYTVQMDSDQQIWRVWAQTLRRWGVQEMIAAFLEAAGPLALLGAHALYLTQPFLKGALPAGHIEALARMLEEPDQARAFATLLREVPSP
jgi:hypothetical protein